MKITIVGSGDAFGTGGRAHTCIRVDCEPATVVVDFGAGSIIAWNKLDFCSNDIDALVITHLHGDHFGGLPTLLLQCQFVAFRTKPLAIYGPPGLKARLRAIQEIMFPGMATIVWTFAWQIHELPPGTKCEVAGLLLQTFEVEHASGGVATGVRLTGEDGVFAYSGDTAWTEALFDIGAEADLFIVECFAGKEAVPSHMNWPQLRNELPRFTAKRIVLTHLGATALPLIAEMEAAGVAVAHDGLCFEL
ncbi:MAG: MBL fold metallo-hydrolase [Beijerinckiaceae bacterium]